MTTTPTCENLPSVPHAGRSLIPWLLAIVFVASALPAGATPVTYTFTALGVNGNVGNSGTTGSTSDSVTGGTTFTNATLTMALAGDTTAVTGSNGDTARLGAFASVTGDRISFTLAGGSLPSPVSGTMLTSDGWTFQSGTAPTGQGNFVFFVQSGSFVLASFMRPGPVSSPVPTYDYMVNSQSFSVTSRTEPGSNSLQDPLGSGIYVGGSNFGNWDTVTAGVYQMVGTTVGGLYFTNGSNDYFNGAFNVSVVPEPAASALLAVAGLSFGAARFRRHRART
jgi:hypothetical protein